MELRELDGSFSSGELMTAVLLPSMDEEEELKLVRSQAAEIMSIPSV